MVGDGEAVRRISRSVSISSSTLTGMHHHIVPTRVWRGDYTVDEALPYFGIINAIPLNMMQNF
jgi:hypothetical protein